MFWIASNIRGGGGREGSDWRLRFEISCRKEVCWSSGRRDIGIDMKAGVQATPRALMSFHNDGVLRVRASSAANQKSSPIRREFR